MIEDLIYFNVNPARHCWHLRWLQRPTTASFLKVDICPAKFLCFGDWRCQLLHDSFSTLRWGRLTGWFFVLGTGSTRRSPTNLGIRISPMKVSWGYYEGWVATFQYPSVCACPLYSWSLFNREFVVVGYDCRFSSQHPGKSSVRVLFLLVLILFLFLVVVLVFVVCPLMDPYKSLFLNSKLRLLNNPLIQLILNLSIRLRQLLSCSGQLPPGRYGRISQHWRSWHWLVEQLASWVKQFTINGWRISSLTKTAWWF